MALPELEKEYNFKVEQDPKNNDIELIKFKDGREYKLQQPTFFELHDTLGADNFESAVLKLGLKCLFPLNDKSPRIDEPWLNKNKVEGINLWSQLLRGLLLQPGT